jgi:hypothetical protein
MGGLRTPQEVSQALGVSVNRYYQLETRALEAMIRALEPRARGPARKPEAEVERLRRENLRLERERSKSLAVLRATQKAMGMAAPEQGRKEGRAGRKVRRPRVRAKTVIAALEAETLPAPSPSPVETGAS